MEAPEQPTPNPPRLEPQLLRHFQMVATSTGGVARLRQLILYLAVRGRLVPQDASDEPASVLLERVQAERERIAASGGGRIRKELAQTTPADALFPLPSGWTWSVLPDLCAIAGGSTPSKSVASYWSGDIPWVSPKDMKVAEISEAQDHVSSAALKGGLSLISPGSLLMVVRGMILAHSFPVAVTKVPVAINQDMKALTPYEPSVLPYLMLVCIGMKSEILGLVDRSTHGTCKLESPKVFALPIPIPPLAEQARIVARVDELMRLCDALETKGRLAAEQHAYLLRALLGALTNSTTPDELAANWQRVAEHFDLLLDRPEAVGVLEQTLLQLAVRGMLVPQESTDSPAVALIQEVREAKGRLIGGRAKYRAETVGDVQPEEGGYLVPPGWAWVRFGDISINRDGERVPVSSSDREGRAKIYDYYGASGVIDKIDGFLFDKTLLLIGEDGANLLNRSTPIAYLAHGKYWVNNHAHVIDATHPELLEYLELFINAISLEPYVTGTAQPKMNQAKLNSIPVALPPLAEQGRILRRVAELRRICADLRQRLRAAQTTQSRLADALVELALN